MFVTPRFVYIHQPKTGGTFVAETLATLHRQRGDRVETVWVDPADTAGLPDVTHDTALRVMFTHRNQHARRRDIPAQYADRLVLGTIRNPYDRYVSQYAFAWWRYQPEMFGPVATVRERYPHYPDLSFENFVHLANECLVPYRASTRPEETAGYHTQQFVDYFFADPQQALPQLTDISFLSRGVRDDLSGVHLLVQERLNEELAAFLSTCGYTHEETDAVKAAVPIFPPEGGRGVGANWREAYTPDLREFVQRKERPLFTWFPEFDW